MLVRVAGARALDVRDDDAAVPNNARHRAPPQLNTVQLSFAQSTVTRSCRCRLIRLSKYRVCQGTTAVNQSPSPPVFNMANNALNQFYISRVQGAILFVEWDRRQPMSVG